MQLIEFLHSSNLHLTLYKTIEIIGAIVWIKSTNSRNNCFFNDPWCYVIPLALYLTYNNIDLDNYNLSMTGHDNDNNWDFAKYGILFGHYLNSPLYLND